MTTPPDFGSTAPVPDTLRWFVDRAKAVKEEVVGLYDGTDEMTDDICPAVHVSISTPFPLDIVVVASQIDRDMGLNIAHILVTACQPDYVTFMADAHAANVMTNPATGQPWGPGEMQNACDVEGACSVGMLDDCLAVTTLWANGRCRTETHRYTVTKGEGAGNSSMVWSGYGGGYHAIDTEDAPGDAKLSGLIIETMQDSYADKRLANLADVMSEAMGLDKEDAYMHTVMGALRSIGEKFGSPAMVMTSHQPLLDRMEMQ